VPVKWVGALIDDAVRTTLRPDRRTLDAAYNAAQTGTWGNSLRDDWAVIEAETDRNESFAKRAARLHSLVSALFQNGQIRDMRAYL